MSRPSTHKAHVPADSDRGMGVVRSAKAIPTMGTMSSSRPPAHQEHQAAPSAASVCSGRCGHCDLHPCQLHNVI
jgi:hypothetical protein